MSCLKSRVASGNFMPNCIVTLPNGAGKKNLEQYDCNSKQEIASKTLLAPHSSKSYNNFRKEPLLSAVFHIVAKGKIRASGGRKGKVKDDTSNIHRRSAHTFPVFPGHEQGRRPGASGVHGEKKGNSYSGNRGFHPPQDRKSVV